MLRIWKLFIGISSSEWSLFLDTEDDGETNGSLLLVNRTKRMWIRVLTKNRSIYLSK